MNVDIGFILFAVPVVLVAMAITVPIFAANIWVFSDGRVGFWRSFGALLFIWVMFAVGILASGTYHVNSTQPQEIESKRAPKFVALIESASVLTAGSNPSDFPLGDISAGENNLRSQEVQDALNSGQTIQLQTATKKVAEAHLVSTADGNIKAIVTYDGKLIEDRRFTFAEYQPKSYLFFPLLSDPTPLPKA